MSLYKLCAVDIGYCMDEDEPAKLMLYNDITKRYAFKIRRFNTMKPETGYSFRCIRMYGEEKFGDVLHGQYKVLYNLDGTIHNRDRGK